MKQPIQYIVYCIEPIKKFNGLLGGIDLYVVNLLLLGGSKGIIENIDTETPVEWYVNILKDQDMIIKSTRHEKLKGMQRIWIEVDSSTPLSEYTSWKEVNQDDIDATRELGSSGEIASSMGSIQYEYDQDNDNYEVTIDFNRGGSASYSLDTDTVFELDANGGAFYNSSIRGQM